MAKKFFEVYTYSMKDGEGKVHIHKYGAPINVTNVDILASNVNNIVTSAFLDDAEAKLSAAKKRKNEKDKAYAEAYNAWETVTKTKDTDAEVIDNLYSAMNEALEASDKASANVAKCEQYVNFINACIDKYSIKTVNINSAIRGMDFTIAWVLIPTVRSNSAYDNELSGTADLVKVLRHDLTNTSKQNNVREAVKAFASLHLHNCDAFGKDFDIRFTSQQIERLSHYMQGKGSDWGKKKIVYLQRTDAELVRETLLEVLKITFKFDASGDGAKNGKVKHVI